MEEYEAIEKQFHINLKAALAIDAVAEALEALLGLSVVYLDQGKYEETAQVLIFVLTHAETPMDIFEQADDALTELETRACPRVIVDARTWAKEVTLEQVVGAIVRKR